MSADGTRTSIRAPIRASWPTRLDELAGALAAFTTDLGERMRDVVRDHDERVRPHREGERHQRHRSRSRHRDDDHGRQCAAAGKVYGRWPGLAPEQRYEGRDLAVTTDFRSVFSEVLQGHLGPANMSQVFPGFDHPARIGMFG